MMKVHHIFKTALVIILAVAFRTPVQAQNSDAGSWLSLQATKRWEKAYSMVRAEHRSNDSFGRTECWFLMAGGGYRILPWLSTDLSYEFWQIYPAGADVMTYHKIVLCATGTLRREGLSVALREKLEYALNPKGPGTAFTLRSRIRAQYTFEKSAFRPYIMAELFTQDIWVRSLYYAGTDIVFDRHNALDIFYMYHVPKGAPSVHTLGVGYYFTF